MSRYGFETATQSRGTAGTTSTTILAANAGRKYLRLGVQLGGPVYIGIGGAASITTSMRLDAQGTAGVHVFEMSQGLGNLNGGSITAICSGATALIDVVEGT